ncbi:MAG: glycosyl hydrolase [Myxococcota bacterium]
MTTLRYGVGLVGSLLLAAALGCSDSRGDGNGAGGSAGAAGRNGNGSGGKTSTGNGGSAAGGAFGSSGTGGALASGGVAVGAGSGGVASGGGLASGGVASGGVASGGVASGGGIASGGVAAGGVSTSDGGAGGVAGAAVAGAAGVGGGVGATPIDLTEPWDRTLPSFPQVQHPLAPNGRLIGAAPLPTNAFWQNVVLGTGGDRFNALPYDVRVTAAGVGASRPELVVSEKSVLTADVVHFRLGAVEGLTNVSVAKYDLFSLTLRWKAGAGAVTAPIVYGAPYVSARYEGATPRIDFGGAAVLNLSVSTLATGGLQRLDVRLNNGQRWLIYSSAVGTWSANGGAVSAAQALTGWVRGALCPSDGATAELDAHAAVLPVGGELRLEETERTLRVRVDWKTEGTGQALLMLTLPHQRARFPAQAAFTQLQHRTIKGTMVGFEGQAWQLDYARDGLLWRAPRAIAADRVSAVRQALTSDKAYQPVGDDPYFGGKALAKLARLILIADELGESDARDEMVERLRPRVEAWLSGTNAVPLGYDKVWGGLVTQRGLADSNQDFGMGYYNDHHFHFGYHVYAAAVVARFRPTWAASWATKILMLVRDIANPSASDPHFPRFRNLDWFVGHSWAAGLFPFGDGRNQESTSEAVNAWAAVELLGNALGNARLQKVGEAMRLVETASARAYWQIETGNTIYDEPYASRHVVGVLWETKVDFATFFGSNPEYIYGIQMIPFTPASESLLPSSWMRTIEPQIASARMSAVDGWKGLLWMGTAVHDRSAAWNGAQQLSAYDDGNSRTNTLYWIATRP